jgi:hypothetical protein
VTAVPWQNGFDEAVIEIVGDNCELTIMVIGAEVTGLPLTHIRLDVIWQVMMSPLTGVNESVALFDPQLAPFNFHW